MLAARHWFARLCCGLSLVLMGSGDAVAQLADAPVPPWAIGLLFPKAPDTLHWVVEHLPTPVNGPGEDFNAYPATFDNRLYFNSSRPGCIGGYAPDTWFGYASDIFSVALLGPDSLADLRPLASQNTGLHEKEFYFLPDGSQLYFARSKHGQGTYEYCDIWVADRNPNVHGFDWGTAQPTGGGTASDNCDAWPSLTTDGRTLYFVSDRPGGQGDYDLYLSQQDSMGKWGPAQNLGPSINTAYAEYDVQVAPDGSWLLYNSNGWAGRIGKQDIFWVQRTDTGWSRPLLLPPPINSVFNDYDVYLDRDRLRFYFSSNRLGGQGEGDIFRLAYKPPKPPATLPTPMPPLVVYFDTDSDMLADSAQQALIAWLGQLPIGAKVILTGHTDSDGSPDYNLALSLRRVQAVAKLCQAYCIKGNRIESVWLGETAPAEPNSTQQGKAHNRRVVVAVAP